MKKDLINSHKTDVLPEYKYYELVSYCNILGYDCERYSPLSVKISKDELSGNVYYKNGMLIFSSDDNDDEDISKCIRFLNRVKKLTPLTEANHRDILVLTSGVLHLENL